VDDADGVQLLHHVQDAGGEVQDERLRHHFVTQGFVGVHRVLKGESQHVRTSKTPLKVMPNTNCT